MTDNFQSFEQASAILKDASRRELDRVTAISYLGEMGTPDAIDALISVLSDDDYGVRWAAAQALANLGATAAPAVLRKLLSPDADERFYDAAHHIFKENGDLVIRSEAQPLVEALAKKNDIQAMTEAAKLLEKLG